MFVHYIVPATVELSYLTRYSCISWD